MTPHVAGRRHGAVLAAALVLVVNAGGCTGASSAAETADSGQHVVRTSGNGVQLPTGARLDATGRAIPDGCALKSS
ncbi:MAG: hypothetical protein ABI625_16105 [bacterium]